MLGLGDPLGDPLGGPLGGPLLAFRTASAVVGVSLEEDPSCVGKDLGPVLWFDFQVPRRKEVVDVIVAIAVVKCFVTGQVDGECHAWSMA